MSKRNDSLVGLRLPDLWERFTAATGETTRCPNRTFLIRRIEEARGGASRAEGRKRKAPQKAAPAKKRGKRPESTPTPKGQRGRFSSMTVEELTAAYERAVGRPTGSADRNYLIWKIREAEKGRIPIGPRATRTAGQEAQTNMRILPLRLPVSAVESLDLAWRNAQMKSRMEFLRGALAHFYRHLGLREEAALFA